MSDTNAIDLKLLSRLDPKTVAAVHDAYYEDVYRYARYRLDDPSTAEDLTSEVFIKMLEAIDGGSGPQDSIKGWLIGTANNLINDYYRKQYRRPTTNIEELELLSGINLSELSESKEEILQIRTAMLNLTQQQQHVLALRFGGEYSLEETARIMGKNVNAVKALQFRAIASLRKEMEKMQP